MSTYEENYQAEKKKQLVLWEDMIVKLFDGRPSESVKITDLNRLVKILNVIGTDKAFNHTFMPSGGGLDLSGALFSNEKGRLELNFELSERVRVVNPKSLTFHPVGDNPEWWYFRLETIPFESSGVYEETEEDVVAEAVYSSKSDKEIAYLGSFFGEEVMEIAAGEYVDLDTEDLGYDENGNLISIPMTSRAVTRGIKGGSFVIFPKYSKYNSNPSTYDGRHNKMTAEDFYLYIDGIVNGLAKVD